MSPMCGLTWPRATCLLCHFESAAVDENADDVKVSEFGKYEGYNHGKGGSMHIADVENGMLGATGIVGSGMPIAVGSALTVRQ